MDQRRNSLKQTKYIQEKWKWKKRHAFPARKLFIFVILICIAACIFLFYIFAIDNGHEIPRRPATQNNLTNNTQYEIPQTGSRVFAYDHFVQMSNDYLLLINSDYEVPDNISGNLMKVADYVKTLKAETLLNKDALVMLKEMFGSAADIDYTEFRVTEGYRTHEYQQSLYDSATDKSLVALPGYSEHQTGLAVDISYNGVNIGNSKQGAWLADNSYKYGFILRYPQNKEDITKIPFEPWHYRYIGQPHAYLCYENGLCFEEYTDYLKKQKTITTTFNGIEYTIYYLSDSDETIEIPENFSYSASSDNKGGIILTAWMN